LLPSTLSVQEGICADTKTTEAIVKDMLSIVDVKICKVIRLGNCRENSSRLLLVTVDGKRSKWACLKHASRLKNDPIFQKVFYPQT